MRRVLALLLLSGCAPGRRTADLAEPPNLTVTEYEVVERPEADGFAATRVYVGGELLGRTGTGLRSREKSWEGRVPPGNHPMRFERWLLPRVWAWERAQEAFQPRERFVRVPEGRRARVSVKYYDQGRRYELRVAQEPLGFGE